MNLIEFGKLPGTKPLVFLSLTEEADDAITASISNFLVKNGLTCVSYPSFYQADNTASAVEAIKQLKTEIERVDTYVTATLLQVTSIDDLSPWLV